MYIYIYIHIYVYIYIATEQHTAAAAAVAAFENMTVSRKLIICFGNMFRNMIRFKKVDYVARNMIFSFGNMNVSKKVNSLLRT